MNTEHDYSRDLAEIRAMMEKSSRFLSLSGWAGILAGIYAIAGAWVAYSYLGFQPTEASYNLSQTGSLSEILLLGTVVLILAIGTAIWLSGRKAAKRGEPLWNTTTKRMSVQMMVPLVSGGVLALILVTSGQAGLLAPITLLFYGLALFQAGTVTYGEVRYLGLFQIILGLTGAFFIEYGLLLWAIGFGVLHIIYGTYIHIRYER